MNREEKKDGKKLTGFLRQRDRACVLVFFLLFLLYGSFAVNDYGISVDEDVERKSSLVTWKYLVPSAADIVTDSVNFQEIEALDTYTDRYYGVAVQLPVVIIEHLSGFRLSLRVVYLIRHFYTFLLFYAAAAFFYLLGKRMLNSRWGALAGTVMLVCSPRILAESFYNIKDIVFLSFVIYNLYAGACFLDRPTVKNGLILSVVSALCTNVRVAGAVVIASCLAAGLLKSAVEKRAGKQCLLTVGVSAVCIGVYVFSLPVLWKNPVKEMIQTVRTFSNFTNWDDIFLYRGVPVRGNNLPRSYLLVWIFISTPVFYLFLFVLGAAERSAVWLKNLRPAARRPVDNGDKEEERSFLLPDFWYHIFFLMVFLIPVCYVAFRRPVLYNGWRHFYFLYAVIMIYAMYGVLFLWKIASRQRRRWTRPVCGCLLAACMMPTVGWMIENHPYEYLYFNPLVRTYALNNFELDYWAVSQAGLFRYICGYDDREEIRLWCTFSDYYKSLMMLPEEDQARLVYVKTPVEADYAVCRDLVKTSVEQMERQYAFEELYSVTVDGRTVNSIFRRTDDIAAKGTAVLTRGGSLYCKMDGILWKPEQDGSKAVLAADLGTEIELTKISIYNKNQSWLEGACLYASRDGKNWDRLPEMEKNEDYILYNKKSVFQCGALTRYLKLIYPEKLTPDLSGDSLTVETELYVERDMPAVWVNRPIFERVTGHENSVASPQAVDGSILTRWHSENVQRQGIAFDIILRDACSLSGIRLDTGAFSEEYPRALRIFTTEDETEWAEQPVESEDQILFTFPETNVKAIRLITGNMDGMDVEEFWSVCEITLMQRVKLNE